MILANLARILPIPAPRLTVLLYHSICPDNTPEHADHFNVTPDTFKKQMEWLSMQGYESISPDDIDDVMRDRHAKKCVLISFDDGYQNNYEYALPVLQETGHKAIFFIATSFLDSAEVFPWIQTEIDAVRKQYRPLTGSQLKDIAAISGMTIGAHTKTHRRLASLEQNEARAELLESKSTLESLLGTEIKHFAFPYGSTKDFTARDMAMCREAGFQTGMTTDARSMRKPQNLFAIPRQTVYERDKTNSFLFKVKGLFDFYDRYRRLYLLPYRIRDRVFTRA